MIYKADVKTESVYYSGHGLDCGNWLTVEAMIEDFSDRIKQDIYVVRKV